MKPIFLLLPLWVGLCLSPAQAEWSPTEPGGRKDLQNSDVTAGRRPHPPIERVLADLHISEQQRAQVRALLQRWRQEAEQQHAERIQAQRVALAQILNADQVVAVLAALPPPASHRPPPDPARRDSGVPL